MGAGRPAVADGEQPDLLEVYRQIEVPTLLLWADEDRMHPLSVAEEALDLMPDAQLRVLAGTGLPDGLRRPRRHGPGACGLLRLTR